MSRFSRLKKAVRGGTRFALDAGEGLIPYATGEKQLVNRDWVEPAISKWQDWKVGNESGSLGSKNDAPFRLNIRDETGQEIRSSGGDLPLINKLPVPVRKTVGAIADFGRGNWESGVGLIGNVNDVPLPKAGARAALEQAGVMVSANKPGALGRALDRVPVVSSVRAFFRPSLDLADNLSVANIARSRVRPAFEQAASPIEARSVNTLTDTFGKDAVAGGKLDRFIGTEAERGTWSGGKFHEYPAVNTIKDMADRPGLYNLAPEERAALAAADAGNETLRTLAVDHYGATIGKFPVRDGGMFLPSFDKSEAAQAITKGAESGVRGIGSTSAKERVFASGFDHWANDIKRVGLGELKQEQAFIPETDVAKLLRGMTNQKASLSANAVFKEGVGGLTGSEVKELVAPRLVKARETSQKTVASLTDSVRRAEASAAKHGYAGARLETELRSIQDRLDNFIGQLSEEEAGSAVTKLQIKAKELFMRENSLRKALTKQQFAQVAKEAKVSGLKPALESASTKLESLQRAYANTKPHGYTQVQSGIFKYFPNEQAAQLRKLFEVEDAEAGKLVDAVASLNAAALSGDFSPIIGQQGQIAWFTNPVMTTKAVVGALAKGVKQRDMAAAFGAKSADFSHPSWAEFAFDTGRSLRAGTPEELSGGWISKLPFVGEKWAKVNDAIYYPVVKAQKQAYDDNLEHLVGRGVPLAEARAAAGDMATKLIPTATADIAGRSHARQMLLRTPFTSITFIEKPLSLYYDGAGALVKVLTKQTLSPRDILAGRSLIKLGGNLSAVAAASNAVWAQKTGRDPVQTSLDAVNPLHTNFWTMRVYLPGVGWGKVPLGGPFRSMLKAAMPAPVDTPAGEMWIPGAGAEQFLMNRIQPQARRGVEVIRNKPFFGKGEIATADETWKRRIQQGAYFAEGILPLTAGQPAESHRQGKPFEDAFYETVGAFGGTNINVGSQTERLDTASYQTHKRAFDDLDPQEQDGIVAEHPELGRIAASSLHLYQGGLQEEFWPDIKTMFDVEGKTYAAWAKSTHDDLESQYEQAGYDALTAKKKADESFDKALVVAQMKKLVAARRDFIIRSQPAIARAAAEQGWLPASKVLGSR